MTASEILARHQIPRGRRAIYATTCPQCSAQRRKKRERCLSVLIDGRGVRWNCHHCDWHGHEFYDGPEASPRPSKPAPVQSADELRERNRRSAFRIWSETIPLPGTLGARYLQHRGIDIAGIDLDRALRWHASDRMLVALFTEPITAEPSGIHRTYLRRDGSKIERKWLGGGGVIRLWPDDTVKQGLVIGEGIETTLAAALYVEHRGTLLQPAWAAGSDKAIAKFPILPCVESLTILVDNDASQAGYAAAHQCAQRWTDAGREVIRLVPRIRKDFNDIVRET